MSSDEQVLQNWGFIKDYKGNKQQLIDLAQGIYLATCDLIGWPPNIQECHDLYWKTLHRSMLYKNIVRKKHHLKPTLYEACAQKLAMYVLEENWDYIRRLSC